MNWSNLMKTLKKDDLDKQAIVKHNEWVTLRINNAPREEIVSQGYDPDILNEFCFYPVNEWDRLIKWAKEYYGEEEDPFDLRILRAGLLLCGIDPELTAFIEDPCLPNTWSEGKFLMDAYNHAAYQWQDNAPRFDEVSFGVNSFSGVTTVRNDKDYGYSEEARTLTLFPANEEPVPHEEEALSFAEEPEEGISLDEMLAQMDAQYEEEMRGNPTDGYVITAPNGETHIYPTPNPRFTFQLKQGVNLLGCDRYGNKLHPNDPKVQEERAKREREEQELQMQMFEEEERYNDAVFKAGMYGGKPEDYL